MPRGVVFQQGALTLPLPQIPRGRWVAPCTPAVSASSNTARDGKYLLCCPGCHHTAPQPFADLPIRKRRCKFTSLLSCVVFIALGFINRGFRCIQQRRQRRILSQSQSTRTTKDGEHVGAERSLRWRQASRWVIKNLCRAVGNRGRPVGEARSGLRRDRTTPLDRAAPLVARRGPPRPYHVSRASVAPATVSPGPGHRCVVPRAAPGKPEAHVSPPTSTALRL